MKNYDFDTNELWFSRRALQELACADRLGFCRHIRRLYRLSIRDNGTTAWVEDEAYLSRDEGGREVQRKNIVYDLKTSRLILTNYKKNTPPDFHVVLDRFDELCDLQNKSRMNSLREKGNFAVAFDELSEQDEELMNLLDDYNAEKIAPKKRLIVDFANEIFRIIEEGKEKSEKLWRRSMFRFAPRLI